MSTFTTSVTATASVGAAPRVTTTVTGDTHTPACATHPEVFQHPLVEDASTASSRDRARRSALVAQAEKVCHACPIMSRCLYRAVVEHDVAGYVAGSTETQRRAMRRMLGIRVEAEDLSSWTGVREANRRITTDEVLRLRAAHPEESLPELAVRLGCSLSTIKRHLRADRDRGEDISPAPAPTLEDVLDAYRRVCGADVVVAA